MRSHMIFRCRVVSAMGWPSEVGYSISCSSGMAFMRALPSRRVARSNHESFVFRNSSRFYGSTAWPESLDRRHHRHVIRGGLPLAFVAEDLDAGAAVEHLPGPQDEVDPQAVVLLEGE